MKQISIYYNLMNGVNAMNEGVSFLQKKNYKEGN